MLRVRQIGFLFRLPRKSRSPALMIPRSLSLLPWSCGLGLSLYPPESRIIEVLERNRCSSMVELSVCSPYAPPSAAFPNVFHVKPPITRLCCRSSVSPPAFGGHTRVAQRMSVAGPRRPLTLSRCPLAADRYSNHFRSWSGLRLGCMSAADSFLVVQGKLPENSNATF